MPVIIIFYSLTVGGAMLLLVTFPPLGAATSHTFVLFIHFFFDKKVIFFKYILPMTHIHTLIPTFMLT